MHGARSFSNWPTVVLVLLLATIASRIAQGNGQESAKAAKLALLVGINDYESPEVPSLQGCLNDVADMENLLIGKFDFRQQDIKKLLGNEATHKEIVAVFRQHLIGNAAKDAIVVFYFSGHGSQVPDNNGDELRNSGDKEDESLVPYDSRTESGFDITDDELAVLFHDLSKVTANITFMFDSCHSGAATKGARARKVPADTRTQPPQPTLPASDNLEERRYDNQNYVLVSGCRDYESSYEYYDSRSDQYRGTLTHFFTKTIRDARTDAITYADVIDQVGALVTAEHQFQHPQLEGGKLDHFVFNDQSVVKEPYYRANRDGEQVKLAAGALHGLTKGSEFAIYSPRTRKFDDAEPIARIKLVTVDRSESIGEIMQGEQFSQTCPAVERIHAYGDNPFQLFFDMQAVTSDNAVKGSSVLRGLKQHFEEEEDLKRTFAIAEEPAQATLWIRHQDDGRIYVTGPSGIQSPGVPVDEEKLKSRIQAQVRKWAKWFLVLQLSGPQDVLKAELTIEHADGVDRSDLQRKEGVSYAFKNGDRTRFTVKNTGEEPFYFALIDLEDNGKITVIYPQPGKHHRLTKENPSWSETTPAGVRAGRNRVEDHIRLLAFDSEEDVHVLAQEGIKNSTAVKRASRRLFPFGIATMNTKGFEAIEPKAWMTLSKKTVTVR